MPPRSQQKRQREPEPAPEEISDVDEEGEDFEADEDDDDDGEEDNEDDDGDDDIVPAGEVDEENDNDDDDSFDDDGDEDDMSISSANVLSVIDEVLQTERDSGISNDLRQRVMFRCIEYDSIGSMKLMMERIPIPVDYCNEQDSQHRTLLMKACDAGNYDAIKYLLEDLNADVNKVYRTGLYDSPLLRFLYSDFRNDPDTLRILLENGADVSVVSNEEDHGGLYAMVMESDDMAAVKTLHLHGVDVNTIYTITRTENLDVGSASVEVMDYLFSNGLRLDVEEEVYRTWLIAAAVSGNGSLIRYLCSLGCNINYQDDDHEETVLMHMLKYDHEVDDILYILDQPGIDIHLRSSDDGEYAAIHYAVQYHSDAISICKRLIEMGADINDHKTSLRLTPLNVVARNEDENIELAKYLLSAGADWKIPDLTAVTPLFRAMENNHLRIVKLLVETYGADVDECLNDGTHYQHYAFSDKMLRYIESQIAKKPKHPRKAKQSRRN